MSQQPLLAVSKISAVYNSAIAALHGVSLDVRKGEIVALLGANGAGKTTTIKAIANLLPAERGAVTAGGIAFDGAPTSGKPASALVRAGLVAVLEGRHVFKSLTVEENLVSGGIGRGASRKELLHDLAEIYTYFPRLKPKRQELAGLTSGGEQQMVAIGRALMARPRLLLLDEPSMGLAPLIVQGIFDVLRSLNQTQGLSILMAEQNAAIALKYAHAATVLENGVDVLTGTAVELRRRADIKSFYLGERLPQTARNGPEGTLQSNNIAAE